MGRLARVVAAGQPHHVTQRGNRREDVFLGDQDHRKYLLLLEKYCRQYGLEVWAYCLMTNHVHLVVVPENERALGCSLRDTHTAYASYANARQGVSGHLWQGRFYSCVLEERHFWSAVHYVERNPVRAGIVSRAEEYPWSSAAVHCGLRQNTLLSGDLELADQVSDWSAWLREPEDEAGVKMLRTRTRTGRPCGSSEFVGRLESLLGRILTPKKAGRKPKKKTRQRKERNE